MCYCFFWSIINESFCEINVVLSALASEPKSLYFIATGTLSRLIMVFIVTLIFTLNNKNIVYPVT